MFIKDELNLRLILGDYVVVLGSPILPLYIVFPVIGKCHPGEQ